MRKTNTEDKVKIEIEKGVPMPETRGRNAIYPWQDMRIGDSFLYPEGINPNTAHTGASKAGERLEKKFSVRLTEEGYRCWRIE